MQITLNIPDRPDLSRLFIVHDPERDLHVSKQLADKGYWELYETQLILARLEPGQVFIDVGANVGYYAVLAAQQVGSEGQVVAFEPAPENFSLLQQNCTGLDHVRCVQAALAAEDGSGQLYRAENNWGDHQVYATAERAPQDSIRLLKGAAYLQTLDRPIDFIKVDTQGAEFDVLSGLWPVLQEQHPSLLVEFWPKGIERAGHSPFELLERLETLQQPLFNIDHINQQLVPIDVPTLRLWCADVLADEKNEGFLNLLLERQA